MRKIAFTCTQSSNFITHNICKMFHVNRLTLYALVNILKAFYQCDANNNCKLDNYSQNDSLEEFSRNYCKIAIIFEIY